MVTMPLSYILARTATEKMAQWTSKEAGSNTKIKECMVALDQFDKILGEPILDINWVVEVVEACRGLKFDDEAMKSIESLWDKAAASVEKRLAIDLPGCLAIGQLLVALKHWLLETPKAKQQRRLEACLHLQQALSSFEEQFQSSEQMILADENRAKLRALLQAKAALPIEPTEPEHLDAQAAWRVEAAQALWIKKTQEHLRQSMDDLGKYKGGMEDGSSWHGEQKLDTWEAFKHAIQYLMPLDAKRLKKTIVVAEEVGVSNVL